MAASATSHLSLADIPRIGFGCMSLSGMFGPADDEESKSVLRKSIELGCTAWDTADMYGFERGFGHNETLIGEVLAEGNNREKVFLVTKFGFDPEFKMNGSRDYALKAIDASVARLGTTPDAWIIHRIPKDVSIKEVVEVMEEVRKAGKTRYIGLGEASARTLREASKYACKELDVKILAFSPLGKGFLTGKFKKPEDMDDRRKTTYPKLAEEVFEKNYRIVAALERVATAKGCTTGQLALAWAVAQDEHVIPIPGTRNAGRLEENFGALKVHLTEEELKELRVVVEENRPEGARYTAAHQSLLDED